MPIGGGKDFPGDREELVSRYVQRFGLDSARATHLVDHYGTKGGAVQAYCAEFADDGEHPHVGDVRYHLGTHVDLEVGGGRHVHLSLLPNPSHLEAVNPVTLGSARAKQTRMWRPLLLW